MKALITVIGHDKVGIIGGVCGKLAELDINILEISQTVMQDCFTMMMIVDLSLSKYQMNELSDMLKEYGSKRELDIRLQRTDIFDAMHNI